MRALNAASFVEHTDIAVEIDGEDNLTQSKVLDRLILSLLEILFFFVFLQLNISSKIFRGANGDASTLTIGVSDEQAFKLEETLAGGVHLTLPQILNGVDFSKTVLPERVTLLAVEIHLEKWKGALTNILNSALARTDNMKQILDPLIPEPLMHAFQSRAKQSLRVIYLDADLCIAETLDAVYIFQKQ